MIRENISPGVLPLHLWNCSISACVAGMCAVCVLAWWCTCWNAGMCQCVWCVLLCVPMCWCVCWHDDVCTDMMVCAGVLVCPGILVCVLACWCMLVCVLVFWYMCWYSGLATSMSVCLLVCVLASWFVFRHAGVCWCVCWHTDVCTAVCFYTLWPPPSVSSHCRCSVTSHRMNRWWKSGCYLFND